MSIIRLSEESARALSAKSGVSDDLSKEVTRAQVVINPYGRVVKDRGGNSAMRKATQDELQRARIV